MSTPAGAAGDPFSQAPLFRELQRVLLSSEGGPVNWELARQVAVATAMTSGDDTAPSAADQHGLDDAVRVAELQVAGFTGLEPPSAMPRVEAVGRATWVERNIAGMKVLAEPSAVKVQEAFSKILAQEQGAGGGSDEPGPGEAGAAQAMMASMGQLTPLLLGAQMGTVLGYLAQNVLGQYDVAVPRDSADALYFVVPNIGAFERDWSLDVVEFRLWVALHEVTHRFEFARPWARGHFMKLLDDFTETLQPDLSGLQEQIEGIDMSNPRAMEEMFAGERGLFGAVLDDEQRLKLARIQAFMAAAEGYGDHVMHSLGRKFLGSYGQIEEAMRRYRETETGDPVFERLLGIEMKREQYALGRAFCDRVASDTSEETLARMWDSVEALPSMPELSEPSLWMARTV